MTVHNFHNCRKKAEQEKFNPFWADVYAELFPDAAHITGTIGNLKLQKRGIDRVVILENNRQIFIDEKIRFTSYPDILLEYKSSEEHDTPGWIEKDLDIDYLCYAFIPTRTCYVFDWRILKRVWKYYKDEYIKKYKRVTAKNEGYTTISVAVPTKVLLEKTSDATVITTNTKL